MKDFQTKFNSFVFDFKSRWSKSNRHDGRFCRDNKNWLDSSISFVVHTNKRGRKEMEFDECSSKTKTKKCKDLRDKSSLSVLSYATQMSLRASGHIEASKILKDVTSSPSRAAKYKASLTSQERAKQLSAESALIVLAEAKLTRSQYNVIRKAAPEKFPSYTIVQQAKKDCYPMEDAIRVTETTAQISLQALLNHTVERLVLLQKDVIATLCDYELSKIILYTKWGFDGSSGHSSYKQAFHGHGASDAAVFITCIVPLRMVCQKKVIWQNPRPSSTRFCRPLKIEFVKESLSVSTQEKKRVDEEINELENSLVFTEDRSVSVAHKLMLVMVDGKVCNALTDTKSTQRCYLCGSSSTDFNNVERMIAKEVKTDTLDFGLSILHGWIRFYECLLHVSYKLPIKKWQARTDSDKTIVAENKRRIQTEFRNKTGLIIDQPKPGFGNSNDGNTARRFFENASISADITKIDFELIEKMHTILIVVSSGHEIDVEKFRQFSYNTARLFVEKYPWFNMPPTLHKFLIHGPEIISHALLPIGQLSEEAQEARNKDFKNYRENFSRKCSREESNRDILNRFLLTSDPIISGKIKLNKNKIKHLPKSAVELLISPSILPTETEIAYNIDGDDEGDGVDGWESEEFGHIF